MAADVTHGHRLEGLHCAAKQISATVATDRPTTTLDSQVSNKQIR
jgi:hypothetical protein